MVSFLKRSNLDEPKFVENVNDFSREKLLSQDNKRKILEGYLVGKEIEVTEDKVSGLATKIGLELFQDYIIKVFQTKGIQSTKDTLDIEEVNRYSSRDRTSDAISIEEVVNAVNSQIRPNPGVAAVSSTTEAVSSFERASREQ